MKESNAVDFPAELLRASYGPTTGCPAPQTYLAGEWALLTDERRDELLRHVAACPACAAEKAMAGSFDAADHATDTGAADVDYVLSRMSAPGPAAPTQSNVVPLLQRRFWTPVVGLAAAVFLGVAMAPILRVSFTDAPQISAPDSGPTVRSASIEPLYPMGEVRSVPETLGWAATPGAVAYRITVRRVDGQPVWQSESTSNTMVIPIDIGRLLQPAVAYTWEVSAWNANGARLAWSDRVRFRLAPLPPGEGAHSSGRPR